MIGSMFSGYGGLDLGLELAGLGRTAWQVDLVGADVRRRHFDARQIEGDVRDVDPRSLPAVGVLCGGFPCQDLSVAGSGKGLEGERSGLYSEILRFADALRPSEVWMENVPGVLRYRERIEADWGARGYGVTWVRARALDAGAPHRRARVFIRCVLGGAHGGIVDADRSGAWTGEREWATPTAANPNEGEDPASWAARSARCAATSRPVSEPLGQQARQWATPKASEDRSPGDWGGRAGGACLTEQARQWATPAATDYKGGGEGQRRRQLGEQLPGKRLNPRWVETLMGLEGRVSFLVHPEPDVHLVGDELGRSYTPDAVALAVLLALAPRMPNPRPLCLLEPCVGGGAFVRAARQVFGVVDAWGVDLDPGAPGLELCDGRTIGDASRIPMEGFDLSASNPPFGKAVGQDTTIRIVRNARRAATVCVMVMPLAYLAQDGWSDLVTQCVEVWPLLPRPFEHDREQAAYVWDRRCPVPTTRVRALRWRVA